MPEEVVVLGDGTEEEEEPSEEDVRRVLRALGWVMQYDPVKRCCCNGDEWCNTNSLHTPVDEAAGPYTKTVLGTMNLIARVNRGVATVMLRLPTLFRSRLKIAHIVVDGKKRVAALKPCR